MGSSITIRHTKRGTTISASGRFANDLFKSIAANCDAEIDRKRAQKAAVEQWNAAFPVGQDVTVLRVDGSTVQSRTRSAATLFGGHTAVVLVEGIKGAMQLDRVTPITEGAI